MPKKTKKQKLHAVDRRKPLVLRVPVISKNREGDDLSKQVKVTYSSSHPKFSSLFPQESQSTVIFKKDLRKSLIITSILILIQFGLFLSAQNNYFDVSSVIRY